MGGLYNTIAWGQQTAAAQLMAAKAMGSVGGRRSARKRRKTRSSSSPKRKRASSRRGRARLVKGSQAAKAYMAKIRRKRKRK
jgi:hypothetical protein